MKIIADGDSKENAAPVLELQGRQEISAGEKLANCEHVLTMDEMMKQPHLFMGEWRND